MEANNGQKHKQDTEVSSFDPIGNNDHATGIVRSFRDAPPSHYTLKIDSFSLFLDTKIENYESGVFEAGGYKWKLSLYPNGNKKRNVNGHISLYLTIADTKTLPLGWEVNVNCKLFVFNHIRNKYLAIQGSEGGMSRFHWMKTECGFDEFLPLQTFNAASNGYLFDDCCVFGAEVFVIKQNGKGEHLSMVKDPIAKSTFTWRIDKFSTINEESVYSEEFVVDEHKWKLQFHPQGDPSANGKSLSLFLLLASDKKVCAEFKLRIKDQVLGKHFERLVEQHWFSASSEGWGFPDFLPLSDVNNASKGFLVKDAIIVEAEITILSSFKYFESNHGPSVTKTELGNLKSFSALPTPE